MKDLDISLTSDDWQQKEVEFIKQHLTDLETRLANIESTEQVTCNIDSHTPFDDA